MKREILLLICVVALALAGCATHDYGQGGTTTDAGTIYDADESDTSDFGRGEIWRNTPNIQRERGFRQGPVEPAWDDRAPGDYRRR